MYTPFIIEQRGRAERWRSKLQQVTGFEAQEPGSLAGVVTSPVAATSAAVDAHARKIAGEQLLARHGHERVGRADVERLMSVKIALECQPARGRRVAHVDIRPQSAYSPRHRVLALVREARMVFARHARETQAGDLDIG